MKINSQELLLVNNKKMKFNAAQTTTAPVVEPQESKPDSTLNALALQGQNNIAFQGSFMNGAKKVALATMMAIMVASPIVTTTSCIKMEQEMSAEFDDVLIQKLIDAMNAGNEKQNEILLQILAELQNGNQISQENKELLFKVLAALNQLDKNDNEGMALMNKILGLIYDFMAQDKEMDETTLTYLQTIINNQNNLSGEQKELLLTLISKVDVNNKISEKNSELLAILINQVAQLDKNDKAGLDLITKIWEKLQGYIENDSAMDEKELLLLQSILENIQNFDNDVKEKLATVIDKIDNLGADAQALLEKIFMAVDKNNVISSENQELLRQIIAGLAILDKNDKEGFDLLNKVWAELEKAIAEDKALDEKEIALLHAILDNIQDMNADMKAGLAKLMAKIDSLDADVVKALKILIEKVENLEGTQGEDVFAEILNAINKNNEISAENNKLLAVIISKLAGLERNDEKGFELINKIWAQLQESIKYNEALDGKTHALLNAILDNILNLKDAGKEGLNKLLDAINKNSEIAQGTQELVKELLGKVDKLGDKADKIIETLANIGVGEKVDLSKIESMLAELLAQEKANGQIFNNLDSKLALIQVTLEGLKNQEAASDAEIAKKLQEILDKIPAGCNCTHETLDIDVIINKLQEIIDKMGNGKNEGILGDLDNLDDLLG